MGTDNDRHVEVRQVHPQFRYDAAGNKTKVIMEKNMHNRRFHIVLVVCIVLATMIASGCSAGPEVPKIASFTLPGGVQVIHSLASDQIEYAEFPESARKIILIYGDGGSKTLPLKMGGSFAYPMNVYRDKSSRYLILRDCYSDHFIDLNEGKAYSLWTYDGICYAGEVINGKLESWSAGSRQEVTAYGRPAIRLSQWVERAAINEYIGRFELEFGRFNKVTFQFVPVSESAESPIDMKYHRQ